MTTGRINQVTIVVAQGVGPSPPAEQEGRDFCYRLCTTGTSLL